VGVGVLVLRDGRVLLGQRIGSHGAGTWALPGGHLEFGETVEHCAAREVLEETGLPVQVVARGPYTSDLFPEAGKHYVTLFVVAHALTGIPTVREPSRCLAWRWFHWNELPRPLFAPLNSLYASGFVPDSTAEPIANCPELFTSRLHLRRPVDADAAAIIAIAGDWDVARRLARVPHPYTQDDFRFFMERVVPNEPTWVIVLKNSGELVGMVGLVPPPGVGGSAELGYYVGRPHWGQGLATEAAQAIVRLALEVNGYTTLTSRYHADNPASGRVLAKLGFKPVGRSNHHCLAEGKDKPSIDVELLA